MHFLAAFFNKLIAPTTQISNETFLKKTVTLFSKEKKIEPNTINFLAAPFHQPLEKYLTTVFDNDVI